MPIPELPRYQDPMERFWTHKELQESPNGLLTIRATPDPRLKRNMALYQNRHRDAAGWRGSDGQGEVALFWLNMALREQPPKQGWEPDGRRILAWQHFICYCQDVGYWAAIAAWNQRPTKTWPEYFDAAREFIYQERKLLKVLQTYDRNQSSLETFLQRVLLTRIATRVSKWRLLSPKKSSDSYLAEALERAGYRQTDVCRFIFGRRCFYNVYQREKFATVKGSQASQQRWPEPDEGDFREATELYNIRKSLPSAPHEVFANADVAGRELQEWMELCIEAIRNYPQSVESRFSLDRPEAKAIAAPQAEAVEEEALSSNLAEKAEPTLQEKFLALNANQQRTIILIYGFGLIQQEIAAIEGVTQTAIAHRLRSPRANLAKVLLKLSQPSEWVPQYVAQWLQRNYRAPIYSDWIQSALVAEHQKLKPEEREALQSRYGAIPENYISEKATPRNSSESGDNICQEAEYKLEKSLIKNIDKWIKQYIDGWLAKFSMSIVQLGCDRLNISWESRTETVIIEDLLTQCLTILAERQQGSASK